MRAKQKIIGVTGAAGFIGSHLCEKLLSVGYQVMAVDNLSKGSKNNIKDSLKNKNFNFFKADISNPKTARRLFSNVDIVVHLAASKIPRYGGRLETLLTNTEGTKNILEAIKNKRSKFIFTSTSDVYGKNPKLPFTEDNDLVLGSSEIARWAYAVSKIFDEHLCFAYGEKYQVQFVILRLFGVYGPRQHRSWWGGPQSLFIDAIIKNETLEIHGTGKQTRTFVYVDDVISAIESAIQLNKADGQIINIGTHDEISMIDFARLIAKLIGRQPKIKRVSYKSFTGNKYEDVKRRVPDTKRAKKLLNWHPSVPLELGLLKTIEWHKKNPA